VTTFLPVNDGLTDRVPTLRNFETLGGGGYIASHMTTFLSVNDGLTDRVPTLRNFETLGGGGTL
jgi:hypothetical protein